MALVNVQLPGADAVTQMDEADLLKLEGGFENDNELTSWVQYHLPATGELVHRSAHVQLKLPAVTVGSAAQIG